ncbi:MAG: CDP-glycerol glycerophosphotransferase family protein [Holosporales bacterium]|nr:CDP-glycerol glycerophosphotransferase family protein [Holosporales bacterium]
MLFPLGSDHHFEDGKFAAQMILLSDAADYGVLSPKASYFYRKRKNATSLLNYSRQSLDYFWNFPLQCIDILKQRESLTHRDYYQFLDYVIIYNFLWYFRAGEKRINYFEQDVYDQSLTLVREALSYVDSCSIVNFNVANFWMFDKVRILALGKDEEIGCNPILYFKEINLRKREIVLAAYIKTNDQFRFFVDYKEVIPRFCKKTPLKCWGHIWGFEMRVVISYQEKSQIICAKICGIDCIFGDVFFKKKHSKLFFIRDYISEIEKQQCRTHSGDFWLLMDRHIQADDNAEHLYRYLCTRQLKKNIKFVLAKTSPHWKRLRKDGFNLIPFGGIAYKNALMRTSKIISSHIDIYITQFCGLDYLKFKDFVFLQHGQNRDDISAWLNEKKINMILSCTLEGAYAMRKPDSVYSFFPFQVQMLGFPRHDALLLKKNSHVKKIQNSIVIMPTWRLDILATEESFYGSYFAVTWKRFLSSDKLKNIIDCFQYRVVFFPHANIARYLKQWNLPHYIIQETCFDKSIQDVFIENDLLITDYSSVFFEMAYIEKPIIYYQFDRDHYYKDGVASASSQIGYFDYHRDGFGPVVMTEEDLLNELEKLLKRNCRPELQYLKRMKETFPFRDGNCCERVYQSICDLDKPRMPDDFDRKLLMEYAENAERTGNLGFAHKCWYKLYTYGNKYQKNLANSHSKFCKDLLSPKI